MTETTADQPRRLYSEYREFPPEEMLQRANAYYEEMALRRTVREFSDRPVAVSIIRACISVAGTAPSGANQQPWSFVAVQDPVIKHKIRLAAEKEEAEFYCHKAPEEWLKALEPLGTQISKPFLDIAPWLIAIFQQRHGVDAQQQKIKHYYPLESVGLATGLLIASLHHAGLACLTHTPSPMGFLNSILHRPSRERPFLLLVTGYPAPGVRIPDIRKKSLEEIATFL